MQRFLRALSASLVSLALIPGAAASPAAAAPQSQGTAGQPLVIGVDHVDPANQRPDRHRVFEYTDFFTRAVSVHSGDTVDFRVAPGAVHVIGLGPSDAAARAAYPVLALDSDDRSTATGTGLPKIESGPGFYSITGGSTHGGGTIGANPNAPPVCGVAQFNQQPCTFKGGNDIEDGGQIAGINPQTNQPVAMDGRIRINAPPGAYNYLCWIHPGMTGTLTVVAADQPVTTQAQVDAQAQAQFVSDKAEGMAAEQAANATTFTGGAPGTRTYQVAVGTSSTDQHVDVLEMLPQSLSLVPGDRVTFVWKSTNEAHTIGFPTDDQRLNGPFGFDCGASFQPPPLGPAAASAPPFRPCLEAGAQRPEDVGDPGTSPSGTALADPALIVDSGLLVGAGYRLAPTLQQWSLSSNGSTRAGSYRYQCTIHDFMQGTLSFAAAGVRTSPAQVPAQMPSTGGGGGGALPWTAVAAFGLALGALGALRRRTRRA